MPAGEPSVAQRGRPRPRLPPPVALPCSCTSARWQAGRFEKEKIMEATDVSAPRSNRRYLDSAELVVLLPDVGLERLERREEAENRRVSRGEAAACPGRCRIGKQLSPRDSRPPSRSAGSP